jgi:hypothetical protein
MPGIYHMNDDNTLTEMQEHPYDSEDILQEIVSKYPQLLSGATAHDVLSVERVMDDFSARLIGQMLDYAANAIKYWPIETIRSTYEQTCAETGVDADEELNGFIEETEPDAFWEKVKVNLMAGKIRMIFIADVIPLELQRVVEFLNEQMDPAEVLALEIRQYTGQGQKTLVPSVIGNTADAQQRKSSYGSAGSRQWDYESFFEEIETRNGKEIAKIAKEIYDWKDKHGIRIWWGKGMRSGSCFFQFDYKDETYFTFSMWTTGGVEIQFQTIKNQKPFDVIDKRMELREKLNDISQSVQIPENRIDKRPSIDLAVLKDSKVLEKYLAVFDWFIGEIKKFVG